LRTKTTFSLRRRLALIASGAGLLVAILLYSRAAALRQTLSVFADARAGATLQAAVLAQDEGEDGDSQIPPEQIEKYVAVYKAMQQNHNLSVDQAAAAQGLSVDAFRDIESRIERDDLIRDRVRQALRPGGEANARIPSESAAPTPAR
jgi:citrate lyase beta subunit